MPKRVQRKRIKGWTMPDRTIYVGRPTPMGNPVRAGMWRDYTAADAVADYRRWVTGDMSVRSFGRPPSMDEIRSLRGFDLACWCRLDRACHADVLLELANAPATGPEREG